MSEDPSAIIIEESDYPKNEKNLNSDSISSLAASLFVLSHSIRNDHQTDDDDFDYEEEEDWEASFFELDSGGSRTAFTAAPVRLFEGDIDTLGSSTSAGPSVSTGPTPIASSLLGPNTSSSSSSSANTSTVPSSSVSEEARAAREAMLATQLEARFAGRANFGSVTRTGSGGGGSGSGSGGGGALRDQQVGRVQSSMEEGTAARHTGRDDRATVEQVLDPRTRLMLFKMLNHGILAEINGCVSTGKEANVYHGLDASGKALAIKIFKTSILVFKDRDRYVSGEFRFRSGYSRSNPRKMVKLWAEKEMRNLKRLHTAGFPVPLPILLRNHVLVMEFFGRDGWPAPRLKDAASHMSLNRLAECYMELVDIMRGMYTICRLVHADLSEYNLLVPEGGYVYAQQKDLDQNRMNVTSRNLFTERGGGRLVLIDVSQSVETDHPRALEFLRMDCQNVTDFFRKCGVLAMSPRELFDYVTHASLKTRESEQAYLDEMRERAEGRREGKESDVKDGTNSSVEHRVFMQAYIPQSLFGVRNVEAETAKIIQGDTSGIAYFEKIHGLGHSGAAALEVDATGNRNLKDNPTNVEKKGNNTLSSSSDEDDDEDDDDSNEDNDGINPRRTHVQDKGRSGMTKEEQKLHRAAVKEAKREKRKEKVPKHVKKSHSKKG
jgi:RIO kinase 1